MTGAWAVHVTEIHTFLDCRYKWDFSARSRHNLAPKLPNKHYFLGSALHHALSAYYGAGPVKQTWIGLLEAYDAWVLRERAKVAHVLGDVPQFLESYIGLGRTMLEHYLLWSHDYDTWQVVMPEIGLACKGKGFAFKGTADMLIKDHENTLWLVEHKSYAQVPEVSVLGQSFQPALYLWAARQTEALAGMGELRGVCYNLLVKKAPTAPELLKNGALTRRSNLNCTPAWYRRTLAEHGLELEPYADFIRTLDPHRFNRRVFIPISASQQARAVREAEYIINDMKAGALYRPNTVHTCGRCEFAPLCRLRLNGQDWSAVAKQDFMPRDEAYSDEDREEGEGASD